MKTRVVDQPTDSIKTTSIEVAGEPAYTIDRDTDGKSHKLSQMPAGKKLKYVNSVEEIVEFGELRRLQERAQGRKIRRAAERRESHVRNR